MFHPYMRQKRNQLNIPPHAEFLIISPHVVCERPCVMHYHIPVTRIFGAKSLECPWVSGVTSAPPLPPRKWKFGQNLALGIWVGVVLILLTWRKISKRKIARTHQIEEVVWSLWFWWHLVCRNPFVTAAHLAGGVQPLQACNTSCYDSRSSLLTLVAPKLRKYHLSWQVKTLAARPVLVDSKKRSAVYPWESNFLSKTFTRSWRESLSSDSLIVM